ncbi:MAG: T9SS type A sorting domain-containing protein [Bacteroidota bacterium]
MAGGTHDSLFAGSFTPGYQEFLDSAFVSFFEVLCNEVTSIRPAIPEPTRLRLYPNPASRRVTVDYPGLGKAELSLYNSLGARVKTQGLDGSGTSVNLEGLSPGVYLVLLRTPTQSVVSKARLVVE